MYDAQCPYGDQVMLSSALSLADLCGTEMLDPAFIEHQFRVSF